ncbi:MULTISPECIES: glycosyltransferase family 4 protein [Bacillus]|uniref:Glycosyltransferase family 4 protein n=1 Tax=Bacillus cereus TaxID=1396 RepID=A0ABD7DPT7_BACCE|nr:MULTISPECIES: glycosyltransferase family 4 protein [Bacillus]KAA0805649.1 glycosyltransferase family 1 protein [Bacillus sp. AY2-1]KAB2394125.1 glycosyltransferase family 4 protein [Bacillus cereus]KAB5630110.1 glycosyltransferase family 4 protein [Bacillus thuringiensis]MBJ7963615.1 glycosyltransferase family 4 protein [Bacillus cereus]MBJ8000144.1 glycosyltransferase family 4 protein [Bacillus cereus]
MKVLIFSREYPPNTIGGTSTVARSLAEGLAKSGYKVGVITNNIEEILVTEVINDVNIYRISNKSLYTEEAGISDNSLVSHRRLMKGVNHFVNKFGAPSIIIFPDLFCFPEASILAKQFGCPLINILLQDFSKMVPYDRNGVHRVSNNVEARKELILELERKALMHSTHTVFISNALSESIHKQYEDLSRDKTSVIHLGIYPDELARKENVNYRRRRSVLAKEEEIIILGCGRLVPVKGFDYLIKGFAKVWRNYPKVKLGIIGVGPELEYLKELTKKLNVSDSVIFLGDITREEAIEYFHVADICVVPSLWESFCYVAAEFMAVGKPIIASSVDSLNELLRDNKEALKLTVNEDKYGIRELDENEIAYKIERLLNNQELGDSLANAARERVSRYFINQHFINGVSELIEEKLHKNTDKIAGCSE